MEHAVGMILGAGGRRSGRPRPDHNDDTMRMEGSEAAHEKRTKTRCA